MPTVCSNPASGSRARATVAYGWSVSSKFPSTSWSWTSCCRRSMDSKFAAAYAPIAKYPPRADGKGRHDGRRSRPRNRSGRLHRPAVRHAGARSQDSGGSETHVRKPHGARHLGRESSDRSLLVPSQERGSSGALTPTEFRLLLELARHLPLHRAASQDTTRPRHARSGRAGLKGRPPNMHSHHVVGSSRATGRHPTGAVR
jgi:hypothetical protein